ncbi:ABC transporter ATP-binding protein [Rufibacter sediminis]|uniref:ABC transporter ATP-binding protein n=1 Tax=Rufibacter sediminis TaxID=2762756 RepID=A0ABR6VSN6_9BACT|nr:ABC transporter ATP-binding protein [Rufibacter sediminis]MBC3540208.1 ABC transporter ATP-binding protein [Rufibacter sediminis]
MKEPLISTHQLTYRYGPREILQGLDLQIPQGCIYGFLGPNGAGKTTTIRLLLGLLTPTSGSIRLFGRELREQRIPILQRVGALIETPSLYRHLSGHDNLEVMRRMLGVEKKRIAEVLQIVRLQPDAHRPVKHYSLGMCQRLGIALALLSDPELLILDEPTNGLDPSGIREMRELLKDLNQEHGKTIFLSSHLLSEIEKTVSHVGILHQGQLAFQGSVQELQQATLSAAYVEVEVDNPLMAKEILLTNGYSVEKLGQNVIRVTVQDKEEAAVLNQCLVLGGVAVSGLAFSTQSLEDVFLSLTDAAPMKTQTSIPEPISFA